MSIIVASSAVGRLRGLIGRPDFKDELLLVPCNDVHTFFMPGPIDIAFLDSYGTVLESYRSVKPCRRLKCTRATATLERYSSDAPWPVTGDIVRVKQEEEPS